MVFLIAPFFMMSSVQLIILFSNCIKQSTYNARLDYKYSAILYGYLDNQLFCTVEKKKLFDKFGRLAFSGAVFNSCTIVLGSQPSAPQVKAVILAKRRRHVIESDDKNEMQFWKFSFCRLRAHTCL